MDRITSSSCARKDRIRSFLAQLRDVVRFPCMVTSFRCASTLVYTWNNWILWTPKLGNNIFISKIHKLQQLFLPRSFLIQVYIGKIIKKRNNDVLINEQSSNATANLFGGKVRKACLQILSTPFRISVDGKHFYYKVYRNPSIMAT